MCLHRSGLRLAAIASVVLWLGAIAPHAAYATIAAPYLTYNGSQGGISFGVTNYGGGPQGTPQWISNNFTGLNDILASPGGTFQLANPVVANNIYSTGIQNFGALYASEAGGGNGNGPFGAGNGAILGPGANFALTDATPGGGGSASYGIESWVSNYTMNGNYNGTFGTYLSVGGSLPVLGSSAVAAAQTEVIFNPGAGQTEYVLAPLILAAGNGANGAFTYVAIGGPSGTSAGMLYNPLTTGFYGLATDNYSAVIPNGTSIQVITTITFYADPASIDMIAPDINLFPGIDPIPGIVFSGFAAPEPNTMVLGGTSVVALWFISRLRARRRRAA